MTPSWEVMYKACLEELARVKAEHQDALKAIAEKQKRDAGNLSPEYLVTFKNGDAVNEPGDVQQYLETASEDTINKIAYVATRKATEWEPWDFSKETAIVK